MADYGVILDVAGGLYKGKSPSLGYKKYLYKYGTKLTDHLGVFRADTGEYILKGAAAQSYIDSIITPRPTREWQWDYYTEMRVGNFPGLVQIGTKYYDANKFPTKTFKTNIYFEGVKTPIYSVPKTYDTTLQADIGTEANRTDRELGGVGVAVSQAGLGIPSWMYTGAIIFILGKFLKWF